MNNVNTNQLREMSLSMLQNSTSFTGSEERSWYLAFAKAWGNTLDAQANKLADISDSISAQGNDKPSNISQLTAESLRFGFMATSSATSLNSTGEALKTMAQKN